jgi:hypothetical protein
MKNWNLARLREEVEAALPSGTLAVWPDPGDAAAVSDADVIAANVRRLAVGEPLAKVVAP